MSGYGATVADGATHFRVRSPRAEALTLCLFEGEVETGHAMTREGDDWAVTLAGELAGARYGYRAHGAWDPEHGLWFDEAKLLADPFAIAFDRRFAYDPRLAEHGADTAALVPKAVVQGALPQVAPAAPVFTRGGLVYELNVRGFTHGHPDVPEAQRGTVAALAHPAIIAHLQRLHVTAIELMPVIAWVDERHLPSLGLRNFWGYNPVTMMALDPGLCPGGIAELRETVAALHGAGIGVILDVVLNHTGESDLFGPTLSLRGLDDSAYAHDGQGRMINDTGCGNTLDFARSWVRDLALAALRHFVVHAGVDGYRFDLAPVMARGPGFDGNAPFFAELMADPVLVDRVLIAEPWDVGPGGYQLGKFPGNWLEWNDRFRDDVRAFWRGDGALGTLTSRLAGSADVFGEQRCRSVNFLAAHDGFTLADVVAYEARHNWANGEHNRDGHGENFSWNNGVEGPTADAGVLARRSGDLKAMLATLFASTGTIMLTAGDEFGRSQQGNNNAYCQDSPIGWIDWSARDLEIEDHVARLAEWRARQPGALAQFPRSGRWLTLAGEPMTVAHWEAEDAPGVRYVSDDPERPLAFTIDRDTRRADVGG